MKYGRPVSELLDECARALPEPFTRHEILDWFREHHPDVRPKTVDARIFGLTEGDAPSRDHYQFGGSRPVLERVERGVYRRARGRPRQPALFVRSLHDGVPGLEAIPEPDAAPVADVVLVGSVRSQQAEAAQARELYTSALFALRRRYAEASGRPWFVLSSRWGLVAPDEVIAPSNELLGDMPAAYRAAWAELVVARLAGLVPLTGAVVEVHAGDHDVDELRPVVERAGATLIDPVDAHGLGDTLAWYDGRGEAGQSGRW